MKKIIVSLCLTISTAVNALEAISPLKFELSDPEKTNGLSILRIELPHKPRLASIEIAPQFSQIRGKTSRWHVRDENGILHQLYADYLYDIYGLMSERRDTRLLFSYEENGVYSDTPVFTMELPISQATLASPTILEQWIALREKSVFFPYISYPGVKRRGNSRLIETWSKISTEIYENSTRIITTFSPFDRHSLEALTAAFSLFSDESAIQETLQEQMLHVSEPKPPVQKTLANVSVPPVFSHPFDKLLVKQTGGELSIARLIPPDHWFVHFSQPAASLAWLEQLAQIGQQLVGLQQKSYLDYALIDRYLNRLHLSRQVVEKLGKLAQQSALFGPDLYLKYGSDLTLIAEINEPAILDTFLKLLPGLTDGETVRAYGGEPPAYLAHHQQWLILSTSQSEAEAALQLSRQDNQDSLGSSAEFRYMLSLLPPSAKRQTPTNVNVFLRSVYPQDDWATGQNCPISPTIGACSLGKCNGCQFIISVRSWPNCFSRETIAARLSQTEVANFLGGRSDYFGPTRYRSFITLWHSS